MSPASLADLRRDLLAREPGVRIQMRWTLAREGPESQMEFRDFQVYRRPRRRSQ